MYSRQGLRGRSFTAKSEQEGAANSQRPYKAVLRFDKLKDYNQLKMICIRPDAKLKSMPASQIKKNTSSKGVLSEFPKCIWSAAGWGPCLQQIKVVKIILPPAAYCFVKEICENATYTNGESWNRWLWDSCNGTIHYMYIYHVWSI